MKNLLSDKEKKTLQLEMLDEIDKVCRENNIRYSLAYGTLLGAIRHKGFIPWDDDVDIMMPYDDMLKFKACLNSNTIGYIDTETDSRFEWFFSRIYSKKTYSQPGRFIKDYGVNIDLYPIVNIPDDDREVKKFLENANPLREKAINSINWRHRFVYYLSIPIVPGFKRNVRRLRQYVNQFTDNKTNTYFYTGGSFKMFNVFHEDLFNELTDANFEDRTYRVIEKYDCFLKQVYGNYMQLPPESERQPYHGGKYYWF